MGNGHQGLGLASGKYHFMQDGTFPSEAEEVALDGRQFGGYGVGGRQA